MNVFIYSREEIEGIVAKNKFPENTAVISYCDPELKHRDEDYTPVDYSSVCDEVFLAEVDDLDLDYLSEKGYTYETFFPQADDMARFICKAYDSGRDIICQCEYGQSRSAATAAAILEFFFHTGISVFIDYRRYPNQVVYHKVFDALTAYRGDKKEQQPEKTGRLSKQNYYYVSENEYLLSQLEKNSIHTDNLNISDHAHVCRTAELMATLLDEKELLHKSCYESVNGKLSGKKCPFVFLTLKDVEYYFLSFDAVVQAVHEYKAFGKTYQFITMISGKFTDEKYDCRNDELKQTKKYFGRIFFRPEELHVLGKILWDGDKAYIQPMIIY